MGQGAVAGVGGTRLCDWWFTEDAVLIDTAGRYTTQDSDTAVDRAGWETFLDLLKHNGRAQPLNGLIVAFALSDIALVPQRRTPGACRCRSAAASRRWKRGSGARIPVYVMFTKADLIAGFTEFFDDLDRDGRAQVWGTTFRAGRPASRCGCGLRRGIPRAGGAAERSGCSIGCMPSAIPIGVR